MIKPELLHQSIEIAAQKEPIITRRFYEILFERYPQVKPLFGRNAADQQAQMLQETILAALEHLDDAEWLEHNVGALGARHVDYGVTEEMYAWVGECLVASLAELCGDAWTEEHAASWVGVYGVLTDLALKGARARANEI